MIFRKKPKQKSYDKDNMKPVIKCSICDGEKVAGFQDIHTGVFEEDMLIRNGSDMKEFMELYGITEEPERIY